MKKLENKVVVITGATSGMALDWVFMELLKRPCALLQGPGLMS